MNNTHLEELREERDLTKKEVAQKLKVSASIYGRWEKGNADIPTKRIIQLSNFFNVNIDYLLGLTNKRYESQYNTLLNRKLISKRCREIRDDYKESLRIFAKRFNTTSSTWSAYEKNKTLILGSFLLNICRTGNYSAEWILGISNIKKTNFFHY